MEIKDLLLERRQIIQETNNVKFLQCILDTTKMRIGHLEGFLEDLDELQTCYSEENDFSNMSKINEWAGDDEFELLEQHKIVDEIQEKIDKLKA